EMHERPNSPVDGFIVERGFRIPVEVKTSAIEDFTTLIDKAIEGSEKLPNGEVKGGSLNKYFKEHPWVPYGYAVAVKYENGKLFILIRRVPNPFKRINHLGSSIHSLRYNHLRMHGDRWLK
ncbi:MAG: hypothetical protein QI223_03085, partial [Candidatus Korarchaeota archaeon]|nr:hypothetical protein [Candidatus Korarchaeota archaeon]